MHVHIDRGSTMRLLPDHRDLFAYYWTDCVTPRAMCIGVPMHGGYVDGSNIEVLMMTPPPKFYVLEFPMIELSLIGRLPHL